MLCSLGTAWGVPVTRSASSLQQPPSCGHTSSPARLPFAPLVYPSLESDEDSPVFKSRSKKRKGSDDAPYSPTGSAGGWKGSSIHTECQQPCSTPTSSVWGSDGLSLACRSLIGVPLLSPGTSAQVLLQAHPKASQLLPVGQCGVPVVRWPSA